MFCKNTGATKCYLIDAIEELLYFTREVFLQMRYLNVKKLCKGKGSLTVLSVLSLTVLSLFTKTVPARPIH